MTGYRLIRRPQRHKAEAAGRNPLEWAAHPRPKVTVERRGNNEEADELVAKEHRTPYDIV